MCSKREKLVNIKSIVCELLINTSLLSNGERQILLGLISVIDIVLCGKLDTKINVDDFILLKMVETHTFLKGFDNQYTKGLRKILENFKF